MKAMIIFLTGPMMLFFTISIAQTVEWCFHPSLGNSRRYCGDGHHLVRRRFAMQQREHE
jgi:hypothetical protein